VWQREKIVKWLAVIPLFKDMTKEELSLFADVAQIHSFKKKKHIFMEGDRLERICFICDGKVKIYKKNFTGKEFILYVLEPGEMFPYFGFIRKGHHISYAEVLEDTYLISIPIKYFEEILVFFPKLCMKIFNVLGERITDLERRIEGHLFYDTYEKVILLLIRLCQSNGEKTEKGFKLKTKFTCSDLAKMIGTSRETVCRTIIELKQKNYVFLNQEGYYFIDKDSLKRKLFSENEQFGNSLFYKVYGG
jgi:CRP/FNR family transcriptional regulator